MACVLMKHRNGLVVDTELTHAAGTAEWEAALTMLDRMERRHRITLEAGKNYDKTDHVQLSFLQQDKALATRIYHSTG